MIFSIRRIASWLWERGWRILISRMCSHQRFLLKIKIQQEEGQFLNWTPRYNIDTNDKGLEFSTNSRRGCLAAIEFISLRRQMHLGWHLANLIKGVLNQNTRNRVEMRWIIMRPLAGNTLAGNGMNIAVKWSVLKITNLTIKQRKYWDKEKGILVMGIQLITLNVATVVHKI